MDRIAIISDVHGNLEALNAVLKDIRKRRINKIFCLGDIVAKGNHQEECVQIIKEKCEVSLMGNCDGIFWKKEVKNQDDIQSKRIKWVSSLLSNDSINYLKSLSFCHEFYMSGRLVRLFHAHPKKYDIFVGDVSPIEDVYGLFLPTAKTPSENIADVIIYGHIHRQYLRKLYNRTVVNVGSVGNAFDVFRNDLKDGDLNNTTNANYLIISGKLNSHNIKDRISYEFINIPYDIDKELEANDNNLEKKSYEKELRKGLYRDMNKVYDYFDKIGIDKEKI